MSLKTLAQAIALESLYQETTYFSRMIGRIITRETWLTTHMRTLKNWGIIV